MPTAGLVHVRRFAKRSAKYVAVLTSLAVLASGLEVVDSSGAEAAVAADPKAAPEKVTSRPDVVSASVSARTQGSRVEVESMRTETSTTWVEPSGVMSTEAHAGPIRFKDAGGTWRDVDLTLGKAVDGTVAPMGHKWGLTLGRANSQPGGVLASVQVGSGRQVEWVSPWALPAPVLDGTKVTYGDVQPGVDLVLDARRTGFEQDMVIKSRPAQAPVWRIPLRTKGLRPVARRDGTIDFTDAKGTVVSTIPVARMWDAKVDPDTGEHPNQTSVKVTVEQVSPGRATLVIEPDAAWLAASDREFPVTVDPTYSQGTTYATFDTWVQSNVTTDESASAELRAGYNGSAIGRSYLNFPIDNIKGKQIVGASLLLYETYSQSCTPTTVIAQNSGSASTSTRWTSQPTRYTTQSGSLSAAKGFSGSCPAGRISIPITDVVKGWAGTTYQYSSLAVVGGNESDVSSWKRFDSLEAANDPYVAFSWNRAPSTPTAPVFTSAVSYAPPGVSTSSLYTAYTRPWVTTKASDADGNTVRYDIEFHNSTTVSGTSLKGACSSATYPSGTTAGCQLTNADLPDNSTIYARARTWDGLAYSAWSGWTTVRVAATNPAAPVVSCPSPYTKDSWQDATPTGTGITCTITATGTGYNAPGYVRATVDGALYPTNFTGGAAGQIKITPSSDSAVAKTTVTIKLPAPSGLHTINVKAESPSGRLSTGSGTEYDFGWGGTALTSPAVSPRVTTTGGV
ncbi:MAG TPA: DNRLRE domain-containing protein, partial [Kribbellaceae bacterium]|nr:DNRLRE domain-containing protein [Kribbellaceae bacterium]